MEQPRLDKHYIVMHLDGVKRVTRSGAGPVRTTVVKPGAITSVSAGTAHSWATEGPIGFAHLYLDPASVGRIVQETFDRDPGAVELTDEVGRDAPLLAALFLGMLAQIESPGFASRLLLDTLLQSFIVQLLSESSTLAATTRAAQHSLAPRRLKRVLDFIEANLADDIELEQLAALAGSSRYHFSRSFRDATGVPPYRYLIQRRLEVAKTLLLQEEFSIAQVSARCGFNSSAQFAVMFKQVFGTTPKRFCHEQ